MHRALSVLLALAICGCATIQKISSPSESLYARANLYYEEKNYADAIPLYKKLIDENPQSSVLIPTQLNLGMSYYYAKDCQNAHDVLKAINIKDAAVKSYVDNIVKICAAELGTETAAPSPAAQGEITITVQDAALEDITRYNSVILKGFLDKPATLFINNVKTFLRPDNSFQTTTSWNKGRPIILTAQSDAQGSGRLEYFPDGEPPKEPRGLRATNSTSNSAELEWDANSEDDIYGYKFFYRLKNGPRSEVKEIIKDTRHEIVGLGNMISGLNRTFQFEIKAVDKMGNYSNSSDILEVTLP